MADEKPDSGSKASEVTARNGEQVVRLVIEAQSTTRSRWGMRLLVFLLLFSVLMNFTLLSSSENYFGDMEGPLERYYSGDKTATDKLAVIRVDTTIMPPFTEQIIEQIDHATEDDDVKGMVLVVDSPGGLVADSHQIYHKLSIFAETKPIYVQMGRIAASGGYYIAMGSGEKGKIFAEPTTWTGSIGVIIPHYNLTELADNIGVKSEPLKTGEFKDSLSMFRPLSERDREVWDGIMDDAFQKFLGVIEKGRPALSREEIEALATGRVFTADQAMASGMIDQISFLDETIATLASELGNENIRVIEYDYPPNIVDVLMGTAKMRSDGSILQELLQSPAPRAFYLMGLGQ
ncbi:signal peptide peptidase SppA [Rubinisphaera margarita]|uniref:signal peptide peptidase SppA n=1 Tax=Rubinisphaera margarita TaxID=2909586 RepID=UPI001EE7E9D5|nr:signal peptide peptidase SppA [Rubinisphaera margarita]MCG6155948.1 signal peptide peptidase SppA [Rubinisphaera margarita]